MFITKKKLSAMIEKEKEGAFKDGMIYALTGKSTIIKNTYLPNRYNLFDLNKIIPENYRNNIIKNVLYYFRGSFYWFMSSKETDVIIRKQIEDAMEEITQSSW